VRRLAELFVRRGGTLARGAVRPGASSGRVLRDVWVGGERHEAGAAVFACGPWLPQLFPELLESVIRVHKAEELFFGVEQGDTRFDADHLPTWVDIGAHYGVPAVDGRSFKVGIDAKGPLFDPTSGERRIDPANIPLVREFLSRRFPALADAPLVDSRVCQYELTVDEHLVIDRHPALDNVWLVGGGSGHAFKLGPEIGAYVTSLVSGERKATEERFRIPGREARPWREA
jgi:glycine/D-amino acid oxidase-like deaminating enzyme